MFFKCSTTQEAKKLFYRLCKHLHPDHGGEHDLMVLLQESYAEFLKVYGLLDEERQKAQRQQESIEFQVAYEDVYSGDPQLRIFDKIKTYAHGHPNFKSEFVDSVIDYLESRGYVTSSQYNACLKIYNSFRMWEE